LGIIGYKVNASFVPSCAAVDGCLDASHVGRRSGVIPGRAADVQRGKNSGSYEGKPVICQYIARG
jgi:hypothetical protein